MFEISLSEIPRTPFGVAMFDKVTLLALAEWFRVEDIFIVVNATKWSLKKYYYSITHSFHKSRILKFEFVFEFCQFEIIFKRCQI